MQLLKLVGCNNYSIEELKTKPFIEGRSAKIMIGKLEVGQFGEISPWVLGNFKIEEPVVAAEIKIDQCILHSKKTT